MIAAPECEHNLLIVLPPFPHLLQTSSASKTERTNASQPCSDRSHFFLLTTSLASQRSKLQHWKDFVLVCSLVCLAECHFEM